MGWGNGIGIGWPNASASNQSQMVYYQIQEVCGQSVPLDATTQLVDNSIYQPGDYVRYVGGAGNRVLLGAVSETIGVLVFNIGGEVYASCPT